MRYHEQRSVCANCLRQWSRRSGIARQHGADICWIPSRLDIWLRCRGDKLQPMKAYLPIPLYCSCTPAFIKHLLVWSRHNNSLQSQAPVSWFQSKKQYLLPVHSKPSPNSDRHPGLSEPCHICVPTVCDLVVCNLLLLISSVICEA